jgi:hypothetical protein
VSCSFNDKLRSPASIHVSVPQPWLSKFAELSFLQQQSCCGAAELSSRIQKRRSSSLPGNVCRSSSSGWQDPWQKFVPKSRGKVLMLPACLLHLLYFSIRDQASAFRASTHIFHFQALTRFHLLGLAILGS